MALKTGAEYLDSIIQKYLTASPDSRVVARMTAGFDLIKLKRPDAVIPGPASKAG